MQIRRLTCILLLICLCSCTVNSQWQEGSLKDIKPSGWQLFEGPGGALMTPPLPEEPSVVGESQTIELMPYGQTELRLTVFPVVK